MITQNVANLNINKLSKKRYDRLVDEGQTDSTAFYLTPELDVIQKTFAGEPELGEVLIDVAKEMLDKDAYECTILLTDSTNTLFEYGTAIAKMYRHDEDLQGDLFKYFPVQIFCEDAVFSVMVDQDEVMDWHCTGLDRVLTENYLRTLLGTAEGGTF